MSRYSEFFLNSSGSVAKIECIEFMHPDFSQTYRVVRNMAAGCTATYEDGVAYAHTYYPLKIDIKGASNDMDQRLTLVFGDLGEIMPIEIDRVRAGDGFLIKPTIKYRVFQSDDLAGGPLFGPLVLQGHSFSFSAEGVQVEAGAPSLNVTKTGEYYTLDRFPMLRGFL